MAERQPGRTADRILQIAAWSATLLVSGLLCWILVDVILRGWSVISWEFLTAEPLDAGRSGGIAPILVSTFWILVVCLAVSVPLGLATAALLAEFSSRSRFGFFVRRSLDVLSGVPSIVFGLFGNALFCVYLGLGFSILSGGLTLACMVLPILIRATEEGFRAVPDEHRQAAAALGLSRTSTLIKILLPLAVPGLVVGLVLGIGRAVAETAALLFTSGYVDRMPDSLLDSGRALSVHIYTMASDVSGGDARAYAAALVLVALLVVINLAASAITTGFLPGRVRTV